MVEEGRGRMLYLSRRPHQHSRSSPSLSCVDPRLRGNLRQPKLQLGSIRRQPNRSCACQASCSLRFNSAAPAAAQPPYVSSVLPRAAGLSVRLGNVEVMWLTGRLVPDHKTIADFRKDNGPAIRKVCAQFVSLCREIELLTQASVAIDGSKFKAVNNRDKNFTRAKMDRRLAQIEESVARYLSQLDTA